MNDSILITGGASGIGAATVSLAARRGMRVTFTDIDEARALALLDELRGLDVSFINADTRDRDAMERAAAKAAPFTILFANAGIHRSNTLLDISDEEFDTVIKTNIYGTYNTLKAAVPHIMAAGGGSIVVNASDQSRIGKRNNFAYGLTKGALGQIVKSLALDLARHNIRVNAVCPATIATPLSDAALRRWAARDAMTPEQAYAEEAALHPLGRLGTPEEVAEAVLFLAGDKASFITGALLAVDGGMTAQ